MSNWKVRARAAAAWVALFVLPALAAQNTINVPADQPTIQAGIQAAANGDTVLVAPGTYQENIDFLGKAITVASSGGPSVTIIDGGRVNSVVTFKTGETTSAVLQGFTIQNGSGQLDGGGISISSASPTITGNTIQSNVACGGGGGISVNFGSPVIQGNTIQNNTQRGCSGGGGGGIEIVGGVSAKVTGNTIINNEWGAGDGGGIMLNGAGTPTISNNVISGNIATGVSPASRGGGIVMFNESDALIVGNLISNNSAGQGGGISLDVPSGSRGPILINNTMVGDSAPQGGSEIFADGFDNQVQFFNNLMIGSSGANAVFCGSFANESPTFTTNDTFSPSGTGLTGTCASQSAQNGNISADPLFVNAAGGDFHLQSTSPAIDAGTNSAPDLPQTDFAGNPRILDGNNDCVSRIDMGAFELALAAKPVFSASSLSFAGQQVGTSSAPQSVTLANTGATCFQFSSTQITGDFSQTNGCAGAGLRAGSSCSYNVTFTPISGGTRSGNLTVTGTDGVNTSSPSVSLSGTALTSPSVSLSTASLTFGPQPVGTTSAAPVVLTNTGQAALNISGIGTGAPFSQTNNCPASLAAGTACTISVTYTASAAGTQSGTLSISDNAGGSPQTVALSGTAVDFFLFVNPSAETVKRGQAPTFTVTVDSLGGPFNPSVELFCSGLPSFATCRFSPTLVTLFDGSAQAGLTISVGSQTPKGTFDISVIGRSGSLQHSATITLTVR